MIYKFSKSKRVRKRQVKIADNVTRYRTNTSFLTVLKQFTIGSLRVPKWLSTVLLVIFFFVYSVDFEILLNPLAASEDLVFLNSGQGLDVTTSESAQLFKSKIGIFIYSATLLLAAFHIRPLFTIASHSLHYLLALAVSLTGILISVNSTEVVNNVIQLFIGFTLAATYAINHIELKRWDIRLCITVLLAIVLVQTCSLVLIYLNDLNLISFIDGERRYGGLSGNPNTAGAQCVIGIWLCLHCCLDSHVKLKYKIVLVGLIVLFGFIIKLSGSGTSTAAAILVLCLMIWLKVLMTVKKGPKRVSLFLFGGLLLSLLLGGYFINNSAQDLTGSFTSALGKGSNFTGRSELWETAMVAISQRPFFGWSLDSHETVFEERLFVLPDGLTHYHNGYLDTLVSGGAVIGLLLLYNFWSYLKALWLNYHKAGYLYGMVGPLVILALMNFSEYSLFRPLNVIYQLYLCSFCLLVYARIYADDASVSAQTPARSKQYRRTSSVKSRKYSGHGKRKIFNRYYRF